MSDENRNQAILASIRDRVLRRAGDDVDFRRLLLDNPKSAIARELGIDIPDTVHVTVMAERDDQIFVVLPPLSVDPTGLVLTGVERLAIGSGVGQPYMLGMTPGTMSYAPAAMSYGGGGPVRGQKTTPTPTTTPAPVTPTPTTPPPKGGSEK